jgi:hypothetical protein
MVRSEHSLCDKPNLSLRGGRFLTLFGTGSAIPKGVGGNCFASLAKTVHRSFAA